MKTKFFLIFIVISINIYAQKKCKGYYPTFTKNYDKVEISWNGETSWNKATGYGKAIYPDGTIYNGSMVEGIPSGKGAYLGQDKRIFCGEFINGGMYGNFLIIMHDELYDVKYFSIYLHQSNTFDPNKTWQGYNSRNEKTNKVKYNVNTGGFQVQTENIFDGLGDAVGVLLGGAAALAAVGLTAGVLASMETTELILIIVIIH